MGLNILIVRHGEAGLNRAENADKSLHNQKAQPLTSRGVAQATALGKSLHDMKFHKVFSSEFLRAYQTAECIVKHCRNQDQTINKDERLGERFYGDLETKGVAEVFKEAERLQVSVLFLPVPSGEPVQAVQNRAVNFFEELLESDDDSKDHNILLVTHSAFIGCVLEAFETRKDVFSLEQHPPDYDRIYQTIAPNTSVTQVKLTKPGVGPSQIPWKLQIFKLHDVTHLQGVHLPL